MINHDLLKIEKENAFSKSTRLVKEYREKHPDREIISLGIGDVSRPIVKPVIEAMEKAVEDLASMETFQGYGAYFGIESLRRIILENDYPDMGFSLDEIYIGDGTKSDSTNLLELFSKDSKVLVGNPMYPIYLNGALALNRKVYFADCDKQFKMIVPKEHYDIIYICSPCNPIGNAYTYADLMKWIEYANKEKAIIIYDNVYNAFIESKDVPKSIYEIPSSKSCCIELRSFSKSLSFTGTRCSYFILPKEIGEDVIELWKERTINRFNGASYIAQKGAEANYLPETQRLVKENIRLYKDNAKYLREELIKIGFKVIGGVDSPYLWVETPFGVDSWEAFRIFLEEMNIIVVPGIIFGQKGDKHLRISSLGTIENSQKAIERIRKYYEKKL